MINIDGKNKIPRKTSFMAWTAISAGVSGLAMAACFWPINFHFLSWIALVPMLVMLPRIGPGMVWLCGIASGLVFYRIGLNWLFPMCGPIAGIVIVAFAVLVGFSYRMTKLLMERFGSHVLLWAFPMAFMAQEVIRSEGLPLYRFSHLVMGYSQIHVHWIAQIASLGGVYFLTFLIAMANGSVAYLILNRKRWSWLPLFIVISSIAVLAGLSQPKSYESFIRYPVAAVQEESEDYDVYRKWVNETSSTNPVPSFIVLPEHTIVSTAINDEDLPLIDTLEEVAAKTGAYICVGSHSFPPLPERDDPQRRQKLAERRCSFDNTAMLISPEGRIVFKQLKVVPVPFYVDGNPAKVQETYQSPLGCIGLYVCYDESFTDVMRRFVGEGAELLLGPVFNTQTWPVQQRMQQAEMMPFRAIELRRCMVRAASSGVSQVIDATGRVTAERLQSEGSGILTGEVYFNSERSFFVRAGWVFAPAITIVFLIAAILMTIFMWGKWIFKLLRRIRHGRDAHAT